MHKLLAGHGIAPGSSSAGRGGCPAKGRKSPSGRVVYKVAISSWRACNISKLVWMRANTVNTGYSAKIVYMPPLDRYWRSGFNIHQMVMLLLCSGPVIYTMGMGWTLWSWSSSSPTQPAPSPNRTPTPAPSRTGSAAALAYGAVAWKAARQNKNPP